MQSSVSQISINKQINFHAAYLHLNIQYLLKQSIDLLGCLGNCKLRPALLAEQSRRGCRGSEAPWQAVTHRTVVVVGRGQGLGVRTGFGQQSRPLGKLGL